MLNINHNNNSSESNNNKNFIGMNGYIKKCFNGSEITNLYFALCAIDTDGEIYSLNLSLDNVDNENMQCNCTFDIDSIQVLFKNEQA